MCIHVDGAEFYSNSEFEVYSIGSLFGKGHVFDVKYPCVTVGHSQMYDSDIKKGVNRAVAQVFAWSLEVCSKGLWPTAGPNGEELVGFRKTNAGKPLCGGWLATYFGLRADGKARRLANEFPRSYQHSLICESCMAQKEHKGWEPHLHYKDFYTSAGHRLTPISILAPLIHLCLFVFP